MRPSLIKFPSYAVVSIHDVSPTCLPTVVDILARLQSMGVAPVTLLVIPGCNWSPDDLACLKRLQHHGCRLAGHGWHHRSIEKMAVGHRLHSMLLSRRAAEHLSQPFERVASLVRNSYVWFQQTGLAAPQLYVPPAWAMGRLPRWKLRQLPYRYFETLTGVYDASQDTFYGLPLAGFEADTGLRVLFLRMFNRFNFLLANQMRRPLRIAIHPRDFQLGLAESLRSCLQKTGGFFDYIDLGRKCPPSPSID